MTEKNETGIPWAKDARLYGIERGLPKEPHIAPACPNLFLRCYGRQNITVSLKSVPYMKLFGHKVKNLLFISEA